LLRLLDVRFRLSFYLHCSGAEGRMCSQADKGSALGRSLMHLEFLTVPPCKSVHKYERRLTYIGQL